MSESIDPQRYFSETVPAEFDRVLEAQRMAGDAGQSVYEQMCAVAATIRIEVVGEAGGTFFLNIDRGRMCAQDEPAHPPFLTLCQDRRSLERLAREAGDSALGVLGGLAGLPGALHLTQRRIEALANVNGLIEIEVTGARGFALRAHFGAGPIPARADARICMDEDIYRQLRSGRLQLQAAFMNLQIVVEGEMRTAMRLALAALAPD
jgi:SCP-2 sterol transfer family